MTNANTLSDPTGLETLENFAAAAAFNKWLFNAVNPYCNGKIIEIGSGIGNLSQYLLQNYASVTLTDLRPEYCAVLKTTFQQHPHLEAVKLLDIARPDFEENNTLLLNKFDTVIALNVIEHIQNDVLALQNCKKLLAKNGQLIILVPAYKKLFNGLDSSLGHFKRYKKSGLAAIFTNQKLQVTASRYFNVAGIFGWWFTGKILHKKLIPGYQLNIFNKLIPLFKFLDKIILNKAGLSVIVVGKRVD